MKTGVKRIIALCVCCLLLAAAIVQNVYSNRKKNAANADGGSGNSDVLAGDLNDGKENAENNDLLTNTKPNGEDSGKREATGIKCDSVADFMAGLRLERDESRSLAAEACMTVIENENADADEKTKAQETVQSISLMQEIEKSIETAIKGEGYADAFACYDDSGSFDVTIVAETMTQEDVMSIAVMIQTAAGIEMEMLSVQSVYE